MKIHESVSVNKDRAQVVVDIVRNAGGVINGRIKLQKITYILKEAGFVSDFQYEYCHYGPYSEELAEAAAVAHLFGDLQEKQEQAAWGATYFSYTTTQDANTGDTPETRLAQEANKGSSILLELAATALFLFKENERNNPTNAIDPWEETRKRKPDKAENGRLQKACELYKKLQDIASDRLPVLPTC